MNTIKKSEFSVLGFFMMRCFYIGIAIHNITYIAKQDSWISIIIAFIVGLIPLFVFYNLNKLEPSLTFHQLIKKYFGKFWGNAINIFFICTVTFHASIALWNLSNFINSQFLFKTPVLAIGIFFMIPIIYTVNKGLKTIGRTGIILFIISSIMFLSFFAIGGLMDFSNLKPTLEFGITPVLDGALIEFSYCILSYFPLLIVPKNNIIDNKKIMNSLLKIYLFTFITTIMIMLAILTIFGAPLANLYQYPEFHLLKIINVANFFQRVESFLSFQWLFDFAMSLMVFIYFIKTSTQQLVNMENKHDLLFILGIATIIIFLSSTTFINDTIAYNFFGNIYKYIRLFISFIMPVMILLIIKIKKKS